MQKTCQSHSTRPKPKKALRLSLNCLILLSLAIVQPALASLPTPQVNQLAIPILGVSLDKQHHPVGVVTQVVIDFQVRRDQKGLQIQFHTAPGKFSAFARRAVYQAITRASQAAELPTDSWTVRLTFPYSGVTMYGESLSAMVGLSVIALAKGEPVIDGRSLTGTITEDGHIGKVGGVALKVQAAYAKHLTRVLIPEEQDMRDGDWQIPFLMHVSPVGTVDKAYYGLTGHLLRSSEARR